LSLLAKVFKKKINFVSSDYDPKRPFVSLGINKKCKIKTTFEALFQNIENFFFLENALLASTIINIYTSSVLFLFFSLDLNLYFIHELKLQNMCLNNIILYSY